MESITYQIPIILQNPLTNNQRRNMPATCSIECPTELKSLNSVKLRHAQIIKNPQIGDLAKELPHLITSYMKFGNFRTAALLYFLGFEENYLYWKDFLEEFKSFGRNPNEILEVFVDLDSEKVKSDGRILYGVLKMCAYLVELQLGLAVHGYLIKTGFHLDVYARLALMTFYGKCCSFESAIKVFDEMPLREPRLWSEAIEQNMSRRQFVNAVELFGKMKWLDVRADSFTISRILQACAKIEADEEGKQIHCHVIRFGLESNRLVCNALITMYSKTGNVQQARAVFDSMEDRDLSSWNSIVSSYTSSSNLNEAMKLFDVMESSNIERDIVTWNCLLSGHLMDGSYQEVLTIFRRMQESGFNPNAVSVNSALQAISELEFLDLGKQLHCYIIRNKLDHDIYVGSLLVDMYVKNNKLHNAHIVFDCMKERNIVVWNSLICGYSYKGLFEEALQLLNRMENEGIEPDLVTYTSLVSGYSISGHVNEALATMDRIKLAGLNPNVVTWTALISGCSQNGKYEEAVKFFIQMQQEGIEPNVATILSLLQACSGLYFLNTGKEIHCSCIKNNSIQDPYVVTSIIEMYNKCGDLKKAYEVFRKIKNKSLASWSSIIMGFGTYGRGKDAISLFEKMIDLGFEPDAITFTSLLSSCKNSGLVNEGWRFFDSMKKDFGLNPTVEHYSCMVELLGKVGYIDEAIEFMKEMPIKPDAAIWGTFLGSVILHNEPELAEIAANELFKLEPRNPANYLLMMSFYMKTNEFEKVENLRDKMYQIGLKHGRVWSWIEIDRQIHKFYAVGNPHPDEGEIYFELYKLINEIKNLGYVPDTKCVYFHMNNEVEKEKVLLSHTEKLAITYGLIKSKGNKIIRVINNTRICSDCHTAAKYISLARKREILVRDGVKFHRFRNGKCSCNDLW